MHSKLLKVVLSAGIADGGGPAAGGASFVRR